MNECTEPGYFCNPVLPGFYPDPSICRVEDDYYLVTSTFAYFPGVPIFHSRDLLNWKQIGNILDRPSQLNLDGLRHSQGIYAPTLRWNKGVFYVITTLVGNPQNGQTGNFIVTATDPSGPWSDPIWIAEADGIDPSLFFDDDGSVWYCGTHELPGGKYYGDCEIWIRSLDLTTMKFTGEAQGIWKGAVRDCVWPEGPHIYKKDGWYYLLHAEGGTDIHHAVSVARSKSITGPWLGNPGNPILTHRNMGRKAAITNVGHGDFVQTPAGEWWMVVLASRPQGGYFRNLGRETFLVPVVWEDEWPLICPKTGQIVFFEKNPALPQDKIISTPDRFTFDTDALPLDWLQLRTPREPTFSLEDRKGWLRMYTRQSGMRDLAHPGFIGKRQTHHDWQALCGLEFTPQTKGDTAGLVLLQSNDWQYRIELALGNDGQEIRVVMAAGGPDTVMAKTPFSGGSVTLKAEAYNQNLTFSWGKTEENLEVIADGLDGRVLSTDRAGGFVGTVIGMFASSPLDGAKHADFRWFEYKMREG